MKPVPVQFSAGDSHGKFVAEENKEVSREGFKCDYKAVCALQWYSDTESKKGKVVPVLN
jgi:hypothetical protein